LGGVIYLNGHLCDAEEAQVAISNRAFLLGDGLFETMRVKAGKPLYLRAHLARLLNSAAFFDYRLPERARLTAAIGEVILANNLGEGSIRLSVSPRLSEGLLAATAAPIDIVITAKAGVPYAESLYENGFKAVIARSTRRNELSPLSRHKTASFLDNVLAKKEALARGADEALLLNSQGYLAEGAVSNLFVVVGGEVLTPRLADGALPGVVRRLVIDTCRNDDIPLCELALSPADLLGAEEAFVTNALLGIMPLASVDDVCFSPLDDRSLTKRLGRLLLRFDNTDAVFA